MGLLRRDLLQMLMVTEICIGCRAFLHDGADLEAVDRLGDHGVGVADQPRDVLDGDARVREQ